MTTKISSILLCGLDGSGKSTQANMLVQYLEKNKIPCASLWLRSPNRLSLPFIAILRMLRISRSKQTISGRKIGVTDLRNHSSLQMIWKKILFLDLKFVTWYKINSLIKNGKIVIFDRFIIDTLVDLSIDTHDRSVIKELAPKFISLLPPNSKIILLDIDPKIAYDRNQEEELDVLEQRRIMYLEISKLCEMIIIDARKPVEEIHQLLLKKCELI